MLLNYVVAVVTGLWAFSVDAAPNQPTDLKLLLIAKSNQWAQGTVLSFPSSSTFVNATERWSTFDPPTYSAAISPATEADVVKIVRD